jgi:hypothetical protein
MREVKGFEAMSPLGFCGEVVDFKELVRVLGRFGENADWFWLVPCSISLF